MKFQIQPSNVLVDPVAIRNAILGLDDTAQVDVNPLTCRVTAQAFLDDADVVRILGTLGYDAHPLRATDCCGSCG